MSLDKPNVQVFRIVDANLNRLSEGLRVLEDMARMIFNSSDLTLQIKTMRHDLIRADSSLNEQLIQSRDSVGDVGINLEVSDEAKNKDLAGVLVANARRAQESLRVLEETSKLPGIPLDSEKFKQARFNLYDIERNLLSRLLRQDKVKKLIGLYVIMDTSLPSIKFKVY